MSGRDVPKSKSVRLARMGDRNSRRFEQLDYVKEMLAAGVRASNLGIMLMDSQTRFVSVNAALARETRTSVEEHFGKATREIVGDVAGQIEPTYEKKVVAHRHARVCLDRWPCA